MYDNSPWGGGYRYRRLPIVIDNSPDIFQQKMNDLFHEFEFIRACIDHLLILMKGYWKDHVQKLEFNRSILKGKGISLILIILSSEKLKWNIYVSG